MAINKTHSDYPEYIEKCKKLMDQLMKEFDEIPRGQTSTLDNGEANKIQRKHNKKLKELQAEYRHLFE